MEAKMYNWSGWIAETRPDVLYGFYKPALQDCGFNIVDEQHKFFTPFGYTGLYLLSESHLAIHTFPEENRTYIELSSCVKEQFDKFIEKYSTCDGSKLYEQALNKVLTHDLK